MKTRFHPNINDRQKVNFSSIYHVSYICGGVYVCTHNIHIHSHGVTTLSNVSFKKLSLENLFAVINGFMSHVIRIYFPGCIKAPKTSSDIQIFNIIHQRQIGSTNNFVV